MTLAEDATVIAGEHDSEHAAVFQLQAQRRSDPFRGIFARIKINRSLDAVQARNRHAGPLEESLKPPEMIANLPQLGAVQQEFSRTGLFFDKPHQAIIVQFAE